MEEVGENIVALLKEHKDGIPLKKLTSFYKATYHSKLRLSRLGFNSMASLVASLQKDLVLDGKLVFHKVHYTNVSKAEAAVGASTDPAVKYFLDNIVSMVKQQPAGIPMKRLSEFYSQVYHRKLKASSLGFNSITALIASLDKDLVVKGQMVFHKDTLGERGTSAEVGAVPGAGAGPGAGTGSGSGSSECSRSATPQRNISCRKDRTTTLTASEPTKLTQQELYHRVLEIVRKYQLSDSSMVQLQTFYRQHFGEALPLAEYMSLYDNMAASGLNIIPTAALLWTAAAEHTREELEKFQQQPFPELGTDRKLNKKKKNKVQDEVMREDGTPVFRSAYHAQLRENHGANMRAVEVMDKDRQEHSLRRRGVCDESSVSCLMQDVIRELAAEGELVTREKVISRTCALMQIPNLEAEGMNPWKIPALKDLQYITKEVNTFIKSTEAMTSLCTLYELGQSLAALKDKKHFEELNLGPLCKFPLIHRMFKIDSNTKDDDIKQIETTDIIKQLDLFRNHNYKARVDLADFLKYLADQYNCDSPYKLGIRITSIALSIATLAKVKSCERENMRRAQVTILKEFEEETLENLRKVKQNVLEGLQAAGSYSSSSSSDLRRTYASMPAAEVVLAVLTKAEKLFNGKMAERIQNFLLQVSGDRLTSALFQLAICSGSLAAPQDLVAKDKSPRASEKRKKEDNPTTSVPSEAEVKQFLKDSLSSYNSAATLGNIASLEKKLTKHFQVKDFICLGKGNFLEFLVKHNQLLQDTLGSTLFLGCGNPGHAGSVFRPTKQDVFEFIRQCGTTSTDPDDLSHIESALRSHYCVQDSRDLGYGTLQKLVGLVQHQSQLIGGGQSQVTYESALFAKHGTSSAEGGCEAVGCLGEMSKAQALSSLLSCPLLEDLSEWSQWELIFKPLHGPLNDFIERNAANTGLAALEVAPGLLLRITTHTGDKQFARAAMTLDPVGTAGHLVSMVVADGIDNAPTALLANHMHSSLAVAVKEDFSQTDEDMSCYSRVAKFLLACLTRIPTKTCQALLHQVFLEPFSRVSGQAVSKQVLVTEARSEPEHMNCLHRLGILLGITDWREDYYKKLNYDVHTAQEVQCNAMDSKSSSLSGLNISEEESLEDSLMGSSSASSQLILSQQQDLDEPDIEVKGPHESTSVLHSDTLDVGDDAESGEDEPPSEISESSEADDSVGPSETTLSPQRAIIEDIRKSEFGIGVELNAEGQKLLQIQQDRLGRSLERLSTELYSKDTHFVLELIQNADDNSYPPGAAVVPSLAFVVERDCVTVLNNEMGFQEKNIRAICDVGRSTKGKHTYGYIGQKGIGFKSVYKVTDCPEIHSNGFHLRFDNTCGTSMGYILPHWTEDERPLTQPEKLSQTSWTTKICLPLRSGSHQTRNLFLDVRPSLLLFLHRLRSITIYVKSENRLVTMTRKDLSHNVIEVQHTEGVERWLVVKTTLQPKKIKENIESTELALAFQLDIGDRGSDVTCQPQKQPVFAYLPLRSFGFRFIVQGDFDIPSAREDVDRDSSWNQWLRSEIPQLFLQAMEVFTNHPEFSGLKGLCHFLQYIPLPDEVQDFFKPVAGQIMMLLKGKAFLPTLSPDGQVVYKLPSQVAMCQDAVIRDLIAGDELEKHLSLSYLHPNLSPAPPTSLLSHLGVRYLRGSDVITVTTAMVKELMKMDRIHLDSGLKQLARLLVCNFRALEHGYGEADSILQCLKNLPIIPLADGRVVALSSEDVFFPLVETKTKKKKDQNLRGSLSVLYKDVNVVNPSLLSCVEPLESQQVRELLRRLGVHELEPQALLEQHIYPSIRNNKWKSKSDDVVESYLVFIKQHSSSSQEYADIAVPVLTSRGLLCPALDRVHFSKEYDNINLTQELPGFDWTLLSPSYVKTDGDVAGWRELFSRLGVKDGLIIRKERRTLSAKELASSSWSSESAMWHLKPGQDCVLDDYPCEEFHALATAQLPGSILLRQRTALLKMLATNWDTGHQYSQYLTAQVIDGDGRPIKSIRSSFYHALCLLEWVPAYRPLEGDQLERQFKQPGLVYLTLPEVTCLLGSHVHYVNIAPSEFSRALGMRQSVPVEVLIKYLKEWCVKPEADSQEQELPQGASFTSTVQHIYNIYSYLQTNCPQSVLKELFQQTPAVFIEYNRRADNWCSGRFYHLKEVCWSDPTAMFQRYKHLTRAPDCTVQEPKVLDPFYSQLEGMKEFLLRLLNVDSSPNMKQYVGLLELISASSPIPTAEVLQDVSVLYATLAKKCQVGDSDGSLQPALNPVYCSTLKTMVSDKRVFPSKHNIWVGLAHNPMIADNKELEKIFKHHKQVCLLNLPPAEKRADLRSKANKHGSKFSGQRGNTPSFSEDHRLLFMEICGIRPLSQCVKTEAQTENLRPCPSMQATVRSVIPYIQRFLYHHEELADVYADLMDNNIRQKIKRLYFGQVGKLYTRYQLDVADSDQPLVELQDVICLLKDEKEMFIQKDHLSSKLEIFRELVKLFCTENSHRKELMHFLSILINVLNDAAALQRLLQKEDVRELPSEEERWEVPEPPNPELHLESVMSSRTSTIAPPQEPPCSAPEDEERRLGCWPPRASLSNTGGSHTGGAAGGAVEAVMKMWPPPPGPEEGRLDKDTTHIVGNHIGNHIDNHNDNHTDNHIGPNNRFKCDGNPGATHRSHSSSSQAGPLTQRGLSHQEEEPDPAAAAAEAVTSNISTTRQHAPAPSAQPAETHNPVTPDAVVLPAVFQGTAASVDPQRPPLSMDVPLWYKGQPSGDAVEDLKLTCLRPTTVVLSEERSDFVAIGNWGEQLVNSFLCDWRDSDDPARPTRVLWCNQSGESGQPYDFQLSFRAAGEPLVYVEVKSTIMKEKSFIHLSANELEFALRERERYHLFRVYSAGDAQNVRLCRIKNLAQHLHTKDLALYLFV